jgi:hypothetical protein
MPGFSDGIFLNNRYKYLSFDGRLSGPSNDYLPTLKSLDLKNYSKKME